MTGNLSHVPSHWVWDGSSAMGQCPQQLHPLPQGRQAVPTHGHGCTAPGSYSSQGVWIPQAWLALKISISLFWSRNKLWTCKLSACICYFHCLLRCAPSSSGVHPAVPEITPHCHERIRYKTFGRKQLWSVEVSSQANKLDLSILQS